MISHDFKGHFEPVNAVIKEDSNYLLKGRNDLQFMWRLFPLVRLYFLPCFFEYFMLDSCANVLIKENNDNHDKIRVRMTKIRPKKSCKLPKHLVI